MVDKPLLNHVDPGGAMEVPGAASGASAAAASALGSASFSLASGSFGGEVAGDVNVPKTDAMKASSAATAAAGDNANSSSSGGYAASGDMQDGGVSEVPLPTLDAALELLYQKNFVFESCPNKLSEETINNELFLSNHEWVDEALKQFKEKLDDVMTGVCEKFNLEEWRKAKAATHLAGSVVEYTKVSHEWCKAIELLLSNNLISEKELYSVHLYAAAGAFISATRHCRNQQNTAWKWLAMCWNPHYEGLRWSKNVPKDDKFILETYEHWHFGVDNSGNLIKPENIRSLWELVKKDGNSPSLVTANGKIDLSKKEHETNAIPIIFAEIVCALGLLAKGGSLVVRMYSMFEPQTINLVYLLWQYFEQLKVSKPAVCKPENSEVYIIARGFRGISESVLEKLLSHTVMKLHFRTSSGYKIMFSKDFILQDSLFLKNLHECVKKFTNWQINAIQRCLALQRISEQIEPKLNELRQRIAVDFARKYQIEQPNVDNLSGNGHGKKRKFEGDGPVSNKLLHSSGSFEPPQNPVELSECELLEDIGSDILAPEVALNFNDINYWPLTKGSLPDGVISSKFCSQLLLQALNYKREALIKSGKSFLTICQMLFPSLHIQSAGQHVLTTTYSYLFKILQKDGIKVNLESRIVDITLDSEINDYFKSKQIGSLHSYPGCIYEINDIIKERQNSNLIIASMPTSIETKYNEQHKHSLLGRVFIALNICANNGTFILRFGDCFTRFTVGVLFLLRTCFEEFKIIKPFTLNPWMPVRFIVCHKYKGVNLAVLQHIESAMQLSSVPMSDILEIVPIKHLIHGPFYDYILSINEKLVKKEIKALDAIIQHLNIMDNPHTRQLSSAIIQNAIHLTSSASNVGLS